jgi:predicted RNA-binding protein
MKDWVSAFMCLLKVYLEEGNGRRLLAEDVALVIKEGGGLKLIGLELMGGVALENVEVSRIDTLNAVMIVKPKR